MIFTQPATPATTTQQPAATKAAPVVAPPVQPVAATAQPERRTVRATSPGGRSLSISIPGNNKQAVQHSSQPSSLSDVLAESHNEVYSPEAFEQAWKSYAERIPDVVSAANYIRSTLPVHLDGTNYELQFSNVMQENEFKKLMTALSSFLRQQLRNSGINFRTKVLESAELPRSNNPEEILKKMTEENPALELLRTNLKLEID